MHRFRQHDTHCRDNGIDLKEFEAMIYKQLTNSAFATSEYFNGKQIKHVDMTFNQTALRTEFERIDVDKSNLIEPHEFDVSLSKQ